MEPRKYTSFIDVMVQNTQSIPEKRVFTFLDDQTNEVAHCDFSTLDRNAKKIAAFLSETCKEGERVLLIYPPGLDFIYAFMGCMYAGMVAVPVVPPLTDSMQSTLLGIIRDASPSIALTDHSLYKWLIGSSQKEPQVNTNGLDSIYGVPLVQTDALPLDLSEPGDPVRATRDTLCFLQYTSGSTGRPKGVMVTHGNLLANMEAIKQFFRAESQSTAVSWLPVYHDMGLMGGILQPCFVGLHTVLLSPQHFLKDPLIWLDVITRYRATVSGGPNFGYDLCVKKATEERLMNLDLSSWWLAYNGAEPVRQQTLERFTETFSQCGFKKETIYPCYGLAENTLIATGGKIHSPPVTLWIDKDSQKNNSAVVSPAGASGSIPVVSSGTTREGQVLSIVEPETLAPLGDQKIGEIWIQGPSVACGYWQNPALTNSIFGAYTNDNEGPYLRTGDLGFISEGELFISGRLKDVIIINGRNHYPQDIEHTAESADTQLRSGRSVAFSTQEAEGEVVSVVAEFKGIKEDSSGVCDLIRQAVSQNHGLKLKDVLLVPPASLPVTTSGKIRRQATRSLYIENALESISESIPQPEETTSVKSDMPQSEMASALLNIIASVLEMSPESIDPAVPLGRYGLTSIAVIQIAAEIESMTGQTISPTAIYDNPSIQKLADYLISGEAPLNESSLSPLLSDEPIAVIGIASLLPGSSNYRVFWNQLISGDSGVDAFPDDRSDLDSFCRGREAGYRSGGFISGIDTFDAPFFGIPGQEATHMDPQQRKFLEIAWNVIEDAGYAPSSLSGTRTGVFAGISTFDYNELMVSHHTPVNVFAATGSAFSMLPNRVSHLLNLKGPSEAIDTACSSSLVALHRAVCALRNNECDMAIAGGVNALLAESGFQALKKGGFLSEDGACKTFDASANGYVRGEGMAAVFLKPLSKALEDNDDIHGIIKGSVVSHSGKTASLTAPGESAQTELLIKAYRGTGVTPDTVGYIETHGTGTSLGDPIEVNALKKAFHELGSSSQERCGLGSVKSNLGHLEAASGMAGLIKTILSVKHGKIPATLHVRSVNPHIELKGSPFYITSSSRSWNRKQDEAGQPAPRRAGVSSFGFGGTYAHVIIEEAPEAIVDKKPAEETQPIIISAKTEESLAAYVREFKDWLTDHTGSLTLSDIAYTLQTGRDAFSERCAFVAETIPQLTDLLKDYLDGADARTGIYTGTVTNHEASLYIPSASDTPEDLCHLWVSGTSIDWKQIEREGSVKRVSLPTYQFDAHTYWIEKTTLPSEEIEPAEADLPEASPGLTSDTVMALLKKTVSEAVDLPIEEINSDDTFDDLGVSSLILIEMLTEIETVYGEEVPTSVIQDCPTLESLVNAIVHGEIEDAPDLYAEAELDAAIRYDLSLPAIQDSAREILLTGATGYLGIFLLRELLTQTDATIHCLVRASDQEHGMERLQEVIKGFSISDFPLASRLNIICGDLSEVRLGLASEEYETLSDQIDTIYHCGATVDWMKPYSLLRTTNVDGTKEMLRFAGNRRIKSFHFISSLAVLPLTGTANSWKESDLPSPEGLTNGYAQSKWVAESLCHEAQKRGLPVSIYRFDFVAGAIETGSMKPSDFIVRLIKGCIQLGYIPQEEVNFDILPVDFLSRVIVELASRPQNLNRTFHLVNKQPFITSDFIRLIRGFGYRLEKLPLESWKHLVENVPGTELYPLYPFIRKYSIDEFDQYIGTTIDNTNTLTALLKIDEAYITNVPTAGEILEQVIRFFIRQGHLNPPAEEMVLKRQTAYWDRHLEGASSLRDLPVRPRFGNTIGEAPYQSHLRLSAETIGEINIICNRLGVTRFDLFVSLYAVLLSRYFNQDDLSIVVPYARPCHSGNSRQPLHAEHRSILRSVIDPDATTVAFIHMMTQESKEALAYNDLPSDYLTDILMKSHPSETPYHPVFLFSDTTQTAGPSDRFNYYPISSDLAEHRSLGLLLHVEQSADQTDLTISVPPDTIPDFMVDGLLRHLSNLIAGLKDNLNTALGSLPLMDEAELHTIINDWNNTEEELPYDECVHELIRRQAEKTPEAVAVRFNGEETTYRTLDEKSNAVANYLNDQGVAPSDFVAICAERTPDMVIGILGILKSGGAYLPMDPNYPADRLQHMINDSETEFILTEAHLRDKFSGSGGKLIDLAEARNNSRTDCPWPVDEPVPASDRMPAYMIYTSGSTGLPKGAILHHKGLTNFVYAMGKPFKLTTGKGMVAITSLSFDISLFELFLPLVAGATIELLPVETATDGHLLASWLQKNKVDAMMSTPATWRMLDYAGFKGNPDLTCHAGGEFLPDDLAEKMMRWGKEAFNVYGPTETTIGMTSIPLEPEKQITLGKPLANSTVYILDRFQNPVPPGVVGEIYISGYGVAIGYHNRPELNRKAFVPNPFHSKYPTMYRSGDMARYHPNGDIEITGRVDTQVKIRGFRIELGEIEGQIRTHPAIKDCTVIRLDDDRLVAYLILNSGDADFDTTKIAAILKQKLPDFMQVNSFHVMETFPLTPNGKLDRSAFPHPDALFTRSDKKEAVTTIEHQLVDIWKETLDTDVPIGVTDDFLEIGGNSILAVKILTEINAEFSIELTIQEFFEHLTIEKLAMLILKDDMRQLSHIGQKDRFDFHKEAEVTIDFDPDTPPASDEVHHIFLTGATGFLGAFLVRDLLEKTDAGIHCLVRAGNLDQGFERLKANLEKYELWKEDFADRLIPVPGDLMKPGFGLTESEFSRLCDLIDLIYHNGSIANFAYPYSFLKKANVDGTREIIRMAGTTKIKPVFYVSTIGVFEELEIDSTKHILESDPPSDPSELFFGYSQTKWVAEKMILNAGEKGLPIAVFRPSLILADTRTGISNMTDVMNFTVKTCGIVGSIPDIDFEINGLPVDYVSRFIVDIAMSTGAKNEIYHIINPNHNKVKQVIESFVGMTFDLPVISKEKWIERVTREAETNDELAPIATTVTNEIHLMDGKGLPTYSVMNTIKALPDFEVNIPDLDVTYWQRYFDVLDKLGYMPTATLKGNVD